MDAKRMPIADWRNSGRDLFLICTQAKRAGLSELAARLDEAEGFLRERSPGVAAEIVKHALAELDVPPEFEAKAQALVDQLNPFNGVEDPARD